MAPSTKNALPAMCARTVVTLFSITGSLQSKFFVRRTFLSSVSFVPVKDPLTAGNRRVPWENFARIAILRFLRKCRQNLAQNSIELHSA
jgi:hypothetical protein